MKLTALKLESQNRQLAIGNRQSEIKNNVSIEIEKKYQLTKKQRKSVRRRLEELGAKLQRYEFEENTLYSGKGLAVESSVLRLRRVADHAILTYKKRFRTASSIKRQREEETQVDDPRAMNAILAALGFTPALVYEKKRETWLLGKAEVVIDELPFGLFMEIEGSKAEIQKAERRLDIKGVRVELATYPELTLKNGVKTNSIVEARFLKVTKQ